jgi:hypothetical protein
MAYGNQDSQNRLRSPMPEFLKILQMDVYDKVETFFIAEYL